MAPGTGARAADGPEDSGSDFDAGFPDFEFLQDGGDGWQVLVRANWELPPHSESYRCVNFTVPRDASLVRFKPLAPLGTHHTTLGVHEVSAGPDGLGTCGPSGSGGERRLVGSGVGSEASEPFPEGVAMELRAGNQLSMHLHLFNAGDEPLRGQSGMLVQLGEPAAPGLRASTVLAGPLSLAIPVGRSTQGGTCTFGSEVTLFGVAPHMHQLGVHLKATAERAGQAPVVVFDGPYDFDRQVGVRIEPLTMGEGDRLRVECTFENTTDRQVGWGNSSLDEMCFASLAFYPSSAFGSFPCVQ